MKLAVGSDHRGFHVKRRIINFLREHKHDVIDVGTNSEDSVDYPDYAISVAQMIVNGEVERGILICGTGLGMSIAANKFPGIRATPVHDDVTAELSRRHNDSNILCLSADLLGERLISHVVDIWIKTEFEGGRHARRLNKINDLEIKPESTKGTASRSDD
ncbi:MAG: ribose 5-phosphate isomerase B [Planctomycetota bacterium]